MIFLSDLHLGDGSAADDFGPRGGPADQALIADCERWSARRERVILVGDVFELWQCELAAILRAHGGVVDALFPLVDAYVAGNHDWRLLGRRVLNKEVLPCLKLGSTWIEHGHDLDPVVSRWPRTAAVVCAVGGWLERTIHRDADRWAEGLAAWIGNTGRHGENERYIDPLGDRAIEHGCDRAVFGHTHELLDWGARALEPGVLVFNCGAWTNGRRDVIHLPARDGEGRCATN